MVIMFASALWQALTYRVHLNTAALKSLALAAAAAGACLEGGHGVAPAPLKICCAPPPPPNSAD